MNEQNSNFLDCDTEVELIHSLSNEPDLIFKQHFLKDHMIFIDNINGRFDRCTIPVSRESGVGLRYGTWVRARAVIYSLLDSLELSPVLAFLPEKKNIKGFGVSDDRRYANALSVKFNYKNSFFHQEPQLDIMRLNKNWGIGEYDFCICSDVLEHIIGEWQNALENLMGYLKPGGVLILSVPWSKNITETVEHYPDCIDYDIIFENGEFKQVIIALEDGSSYSAQFPIFHGGPGNTLEMRFFSLNQLISEGLRLGFSSYTLYGLNVPRFGIMAEPDAPEILVFRK